MNPIGSLFSGAGPLMLFVAKATVLLVAAAVAMIPLRRSTAGARYLVWLAALVGVLALPLLSRVNLIRLGVLPSSFAGPELVAMSPPQIPDLVAAAPPSIPAPATSVVIESANAAPAVVVVAGTPVAAMEPPPFGFAESVSDSFFPSSIPATLAIIWGAVAIALIGWLVAGAISVRRIVAGATELTTPDWTTPLCEVADRLDLELPPRLVMSDRIEMAFACRALSPTVVLPASAESWTDDRRRAVLFHELAHVKRHDLLGHTLGRVACALYWFHPLVWTAAKNLRNESERACDDLVLSCGARPSEYAQHLLDMVTSVRDHGAPIMALPMARKKEFEGRMLAILDPAIRRASPGKLQAAGVVAMIALLSVTVAAVSPVAATPAPELAQDPFVPVPAPAPWPAPAPAPARNQAVIVHADTDSVVRVSTATSSSISTRTSTTQNSIRTDDSIAPLANSLAKLIAGAANAGISQASREIAKAFQGQARGDTTRVPLLIQILSNDGDASVRRTAAWGLSDLHTSAVAPALIKALKQDADASVREMSAWALAEHERDDVAVSLADAMLHDKSSRVRATAVWALGDIGARQQASAVESALVDSDADVRYTAIWALGQFDLRSAPKGLVNSLTDPSERVRLVTAWALGEIEDRSTASAIANAFQTETDGRVRSAELRALAAMGQANQSVIDIALKSNDSELRRRAVAMLAGSDAGVWPWPWPWPQPRPTP